MRENQPMVSCTPLFFADAMLGKLARWLRMLGYDTAYQRDITDSDLVRWVLREDRWLLTRDGYLIKRKVLQGRFTLIHSDYIQDQIRQLGAELQINLVVDGKTLSRCAACNQILAPLSPSEARPLVPALVAEQYSKFVRCPNCRQIYWPGSHWSRIQHQLQQLEETST